MEGPLDLNNLWNSGYASPRTLYATAAPRANTITSNRSFFTVIPFRQRVNVGTLPAPSGTRSPRPAGGSQTGA